MRILMVVGCLFVAQTLSAKIVLGPSRGPAEWRKLQFTSNWVFPPPSGSAWEAFPEQFSFRVRSRDLLVTRARRFGDRPHQLGSRRFSISLDTGIVRDSSPGEWESSKPIAMHDDSFFRPPPTLKGQSVFYGGRRFAGLGSLNEEHAFSPSPDGTWIALMSYSGNTFRPSGLFDFPKTRPRGKLYVEIFRVSSGEKVAELQGTFDFENPFEPLNNSIWISDRHFIVPQGGFSGDGETRRKPGTVHSNTQNKKPQSFDWGFS
jgi:hypothetical protein